MKWDGNFSVGKYEYRWFSNSLWLKVFFHDMSTFEGFFSEEEAMSCNNVTKYSILTELNNSMRQNNGNFEFILEYPQLDVIHWWQQRNSPLNETEAGQNYTEGYKEILLQSPILKWGGLAKSSTRVDHFTLINGSPSDITENNFYYAIGVYNGVKWGNNMNLPANNKATDIVYLWVKMPGNPHITCRRFRQHHYFLYYMTIILSI